MKRDLWNKFAGKFETIEDAPESHRMAFLNILQTDDVVRCLVFSSENKTPGTISPGTLLAVTNKGWILVSAEDDEFETSIRCDYADTLLMELTFVHLLGVLKIDFRTEDGTQCASIAFNKASLKCYQEAIRLLLDGIESECTRVLVAEEQATSVQNGLSAKSQGAVSGLKPTMERATDTEYRLSIFGGRACRFQYELSPECILALTECELVCLCEGRISPEGMVGRDGHSITYVPLSRLHNYRFEEAGQPEKLRLKIRTFHGGRTLAWDFSKGQRTEVESFMAQIKQQQSASNIPL